MNRSRGIIGIQDELQFETLRKKLDHLLIQDDMYWRQRANTHWYRDGDLNTKVFQTTKTSRKKVNKILALENEDGVRIPDEVGIHSIAKSYFEKLFEEKESSHNLVVNLLSQVINTEDNEHLTASFRIEEFKEAMFSMHPDECLGPDGFNPGFYYHFWNMCSEDIFQKYCQWLNEGQFPPSLNSRNIALIPKGSEQKSMKLCNVLCKLLHQVLANWLQLILHKCITDTQSASVLGRSILDNALVAIEVVHYMKTKSRVLE